MDFQSMDMRTKVGLGLSGACGILAFIPSTNGAFLLIKGLFFLGLLVFMYFGASSGSLDKTIQIIVEDVRDDKRYSYRKALMSALDRLGKAEELELDSREVGVAVRTKRHIDDVKKAADGCQLKIQWDSALGILRYTSLEAIAGMLVAVTGKATPGSEVEIEGVRGKIQVGDAGSFTAEIPLGLVRQNESRGYIPARCTKGRLTEDIQIPIPK